MRKARKPELQVVTTPVNLAAAEQLGQNGMLTTQATYTYAPAAARDFQVIDISSSTPALLAVVKGVKHRTTDDETGTTFLLGSEGLTIVRRLSVEREHEIHEMQMCGN